MRRSLPAEPSSPAQNSLAQAASPRPRGWLYAFWKFSRPHTIVGTTLSVAGLSLMAWGLAGGDPLSMPLEQPYGLTIGLALLACLAGNLYIVGLNQLEDIAIDRINKPHLPLAAGEFTRFQARWIVGIMGLLALGLSASQGWFLMGTVWLSLFIGTAYSLPPIRLKRFPFLASLCILSVRGVIVNLGLFLHFQHLRGDRLSLPPAIWALTLFILVFTLAIAIFKDIPDLEGDRRYNIRTFTIQLGPQAVFNLSRWVLALCYGGMLLAAPLLPNVNTWGLMLSHGILLGIMGWCSRQVDLGDKGAIAHFYQFIWKLFFLEYLIFPALCLGIYL